MPLVAGKVMGLAFSQIWVGTTDASTCGIGKTVKVVWSVLVQPFGEKYVYTIFKGVLTGKMLGLKTLLGNTLLFTVKTPDAPTLPVRVIGASFWQNNGPKPLSMLAC